MSVLHGASRHGEWVTLCGSYCTAGNPAVKDYKVVTCKRCLKEINKKKGV
jgi:hypothetical protein